MTRGECIGLSTWTTWKCGVVDLPFGRTKGIVQGFGSVGANAARLLDEWGATVVALERLSKAHEARGLRP